MSTATTEANAGMAQAYANAGAAFRAAAGVFVLRYLASQGPSSGEAITDACVAAGIEPDNDQRAFGAVFRRLSQDGLIERVGDCLREKGHASRGGSIWKLTS